MATNTFRFLALGGTGSIGYAFTQELLRHQEQVILLVRNKQKAANLFGHWPTLQLIEGDAQDGELLKKLGAEATHIFHGVNYPFEKWQNNMERVTQNIIEAAAINKSTIFFPGNIYNFGLVDTITEETPPHPITKKGAIRVKLEQMLQQAAQQGKCRVINLRMPDFWGPNVMNKGIAPIFMGALNGDPMPWLYRNNIPHQLVYTPDAAMPITNWQSCSRRNLIPNITMPGRWYPVSSSGRPRLLLRPAPSRSTKCIQAGCLS